MLNEKILKKIILEELEKIEEAIQEKLILGKYPVEQTRLKALQEFGMLSKILLNDKSAINMYLEHLFSLYITGQTDDAPRITTVEIQEFMKKLEIGLQVKKVNK